MPCFITVIRIEEESDWLDILISEASLEFFYPYVYPLTKELNPWLIKVEEIFIKTLKPFTTIPHLN